MTGDPVRGAVLLLMRVCDPAVPDWKTSRADARAAINLAKGVPPDGIDSLGYSHTNEGYAEARRSWVRLFEQFGGNDCTRRDLAWAHGLWLAARPDLADGDDWLAEGTKLHLGRGGGCQSWLRDGCDLHPCPGVGDRWGTVNGEPACPSCQLTPAWLEVPRPRRRPRPGMPPVQDARGPWTGVVPGHPRQVP